jgi:hypothetical protein
MEQTRFRPVTVISPGSVIKSHPGSEVDAVQDILGKSVPIAGGYSLGQIIPGKDSAAPQLLNQHIVVVAFGEV